MTPACRPWHSAAGFTLVEIVVGLAIAGLVSLIVMQSIGMTTRGVTRLSSHVERLDQRRGFEMQMRRAFASMPAIPVFDGEPGFIGRSGNLSFLSIVDDGGPALYRIKLAFDATRADRPVILTRLLADSAAAPRVAEGVVARNVRTFSLAYYGAASRDDKPAWLQSWEARTEPPLLVRILFDDGDGIEHPPIVLRLGNGG